MDKKRWINRNLDENYICPICKRGFLVLKDFDKIQTPESREDNFEVKDKINSNVQVQYYYYSAKLECNKCKETIFCAGDFFDSFYDDYLPSINERMTPKIFFPTLDIIDIPSLTPNIVKEEIKKSFDLYWINESACANSIRRSLEYLMDVEGVKKVGISEAGKSYKINLHKRLKSFTKVDSDLLISIKWIGNEGTHGIISIEDLLTGYEILEYALAMAYGKDAKYYKDKALKITEKLTK